VVTDIRSYLAHYYSFTQFTISPDAASLFKVLISPFLLSTLSTKSIKVKTYPMANLPTLNLITSKRSRHWAITLQATNVQFYTLKTGQSLMS